MIDNTWKVHISDTLGYYLKGDYVHRESEYENLPPNFWRRNTRIDVGENLILYHGTSEQELPTILKYGLRPLGSKHTTAGGESRIRMEENKNILYLAGTLQDAYRYADLKARWNMRAKDNTQYSYVEHYEWDHWFIKPIVLKVKVPDFTKLRSDDDRIIYLIKQKASELWSAMPEEQKNIEKIKTVEWFNEHNISYKPEDISNYLWTISDNGCNAVIKHIDKSEWNNWKASLASHNQIGYEGLFHQHILRY